MPRVANRSGDRASGGDRASTTGLSAGAGEFIVLTQNSTKLLVAFALLVVFVAAVVGYSIWRTAQGVTSRAAGEKAAAGTAAMLPPAAVPTNVLRARDANRATWQALLQPPAINITAPGSGDPAARSDAMREIQKQTRDDGVLRKIAVNGAPVPPQLVQEAVFNNHNFATRANYEFTQTQNKLAHDPSQERPRSMFGPLTAPLAAGGFAMDVNGKVIK